MKKKTVDLIFLVVFLFLIFNENAEDYRVDLDSPDSMKIGVFSLVMYIMFFRNYFIGFVAGVWYFLPYFE